MQRVIIAIVAGTAFLAAARLNAEIYNAANDFNPSLNPNGAWSYGLRSTGGGVDFTSLSLSGNYPFRSGYQPTDTWFQGWYNSTTAPPHVRRAKLPIGAGISQNARRPVAGCHRCNAGRRMSTQ